MKPNTKPTEQQQQQMTDELHRLISTFGAEQVQQLTGVGASTVRQWLSRGRISATAAHAVCKCQVVRQFGFSRESLRPDVRVWTIGG